jgi:uncharacterized protein (TIGR02996 family)
MSLADPTSSREARALLADIRANPDDDTPRLVYADWLEENGDADRAQIIRLQIQRARLPEYDGGAATLLRRERTLLKAHGADWGEVPPGLGIKGELRRGFVEHITLTPQAFLDHAGAVFERLPIRSIFFSHADGLPGLVGRLAQSPLLARVAALRFGPRPHGTSGLADAGMRTLLASPHLKGLRVLAAQRNDLTSEGARAVAEAGHLTALTGLDLGSNPIDVGGALALARAAHLAGLTDLGLSDTQLGANGAVALATSAHLTHLERLDLVRARILTDGVRALAGSQTLLSSVRVLRLNRLGLKIRAAQALARCPHLAGLRALELNTNRLADEGVEELAASPHLAGLLVLSLRKNRISAAGARALGASEHLAGLKTLDLGANLITPREREQLRERFGGRWGRF